MSKGKAEVQNQEETGYVGSLHIFGPQMHDQRVESKIGLGEVDFLQRSGSRCVNDDGKQEKRGLPQVAIQPNQARSPFPLQDVRPEDECSCRYRKKHFRSDRHVPHISIK